LKIVFVDSLSHCFSYFYHFLNVYDRAFQKHRLTKRFQPQPNVSSDLIEVSTLTFDRDPDPFLFQLYDFSGEEMSLLCNFLWSNRTFFLICFSILNMEEDSLKYWLKIISIFAPKAPIIIVMTHLDHRVLTDDDVRSHYEKIKTIKETMQCPKVFSSLQIIYQIG
jgi:hypothetical protein